MNLKPLVEHIIQYQKDKDLSILSIIEMYKKQIRHDVNSAFKMSEPLRKQYSELFNETPSFLSFLFSLIGDIDIPHNTSYKETSIHVDNLTRQLKELKNSNEKFKSNIEKLSKTNFSEAELEQLKKDKILLSSENEELKNSLKKCKTDMEEKESFHLKQLSECKENLKVKTKEYEDAIKENNKQLNECKENLKVKTKEYEDAMKEKVVIQKKLEEEIKKLQDDINLKTKSLDLEITKNSNTEKKLEKMQNNFEAKVRELTEELKKNSNIENKFQEMQISLRNEMQQLQSDLQTKQLQTIDELNLQTLSAKYAVSNAQLLTMIDNIFSVLLQFETAIIPMKESESKINYLQENTYLILSEVVRQYAMLKDWVRMTLNVKTDAQMIEHIQKITTSPPYQLPGGVFNPQILYRPSNVPTDSNVSSIPIAALSQYPSNSELQISNATLASQLHDSNSELKMLTCEVEQATREHHELVDIDHILNLLDNTSDSNGIPKNTEFYEKIIKSMQSKPTITEYTADQECQKNLQKCKIELERRYIELQEIKTKFDRQQDLMQNKHDKQNCDNYKEKYSDLNNRYQEMKQNYTKAEENKDNQITTLQLQFDNCQKEKEKLKQTAKLNDDTINLLNEKLKEAQINIVSLEGKNNQITELNLKLENYLREKEKSSETAETRNDIVSLIHKNDEITRLENCLRENEELKFFIKSKDDILKEKLNDIDSLKDKNEQSEKVKNILNLKIKKQETQLKDMTVENENLNINFKKCSQELNDLKKTLQKSKALEENMDISTTEKKNSEGALNLKQEMSVAKKQVSFHKKLTPKPKRIIIGERKKQDKQDKEKEPILQRKKKASYPEICEHYKKQNANLRKQMEEEKKQLLLINQHYKEDFEKELYKLKEQLSQEIEKNISLGKSLEKKIEENHEIVNNNILLTQSNQNVIAAKETEVLSLRNFIEENDNLKKENKSFSETLEAHSITIFDLEETIRTKENEISTLNNKNMELNENIATLNNKIFALEEENALLKKANVNLRYRVNRTKRGSKIGAFPTFTKEIKKRQFKRNNEFEFSEPNHEYIWDSTEMELELSEVETDSDALQRCITEKDTCKVELAKLRQQVNDYQSMSKGTEYVTGPAHILTISNFKLLFLAFFKYHFTKLSNPEKLNLIEDDKRLLNDLKQLLNELQKENQYEFNTILKMYVERQIATLTNVQIPIDSTSTVEDFLTYTVDKIEGLIREMKINEEFEKFLNIQFSSYQLPDITVVESKENIKQIFYYLKSIFNTNEIRKMELHLQEIDKIILDTYPIHSAMYNVEKENFILQLLNEYYTSIKTYSETVI